MRELDKEVAIGVTPCQLFGHTMRTRSGHCAQCNTHTFAFRRRFNKANYIYIALSGNKSLLKIGVSNNPFSRISTLNSMGYGGACDWIMEWSEYCEKAGRVEDAGKTVGPYLQAQLREFEDHPIVGEVRGMGMFAGIELVKDKSSRERLAPDSAGAIYCRNVAIENGLMLRATGDAMIMSPPLICNQDEIDSLVDKLAIALDQTAKHYSVTG